ncbi:type II toxin-antitoxin system RelE/ParE family toxin [Planktosalinus lacus]|uniref:Type II toxin-antitoxin system RelE/ParE family toxin n=1 Tax=Planktosalinus lacus TaxID=1526573 RepID=A0A8J2V8Z2_9FLAO|nr:type II toxin-antitoxin system RelE/ParE family toxin [Planktosalinus lacus]GGD85156.1 hypothetical protein GCM10011312_06510 [Planktosalinus lacus]
MIYVVISNEAQFDLDEAVNWYEHKQSGLGLRFLSNVESTVNYIRKNPLASPVIYSKIRVCIVKSFPFTIHYKYYEEEKIIFVSGVFHMALNPKAWTKRNQ